MKKCVGSRWVVALLVGGMALGSVAVRPALGQPSGGVKATAAPAQAAALFQEGLDAAAANDWPKARDCFNKAFELRKHWKIAANLGRAEVKLGLYREAAEHLDYFLSNAGPQDVAPKDRQAVDAMLKQAQSHVATLTIVLPMTGVVVLVDGKAVGTSPLPGRLFLQPGSRVLEARREGYEPAQERLSVSAGSSQQVVFDMKPVNKGTGPVQTASTQEGHVLEGSNGGTDTGLATVTDSSMTKPAWRLWAVGTGVGIAVVGLGIGTGFMVAGEAQAKEGAAVVDFLKYRTGADTTICAQDLQDKQLWRAMECSKINDSISRMRTFRTVGIVGFVAGGAAAVVALTVALLPAGAVKKDAKFRVFPAVSATSSSLILTGSF